MKSTHSVGHTKLPPISPSQVNLWIELGSQQKWRLLSFRYDEMAFATIIVEQFVLFYMIFTLRIAWTVSVTKKASVFSLRARSVITCGCVMQCSCLTSKRIERRLHLSEELCRMHKTTFSLPLCHVSNPDNNLVTNIITIIMAIDTIPFFKVPSYTWQSEVYSYTA